MGALVLAEFDTAPRLLEAARRLRESGVRGLDTHTPYPVPGLSEALGLKRSPVPLIALVCALLGIATAYGLQYYPNVVDYPINVGGRPPHAPPSFIPIVFELGVLFGAFGVFFGLLGLFRLPQPYYRGHRLEAFRTATLDSFWLSADLPEGESAAALTAELERLGAKSVSTVLED